MNVYPISAIDMSFYKSDHEREFLFGAGKDSAIGWIPASGDGQWGNGCQDTVEYKNGRISPIFVWEQATPYFDDALEPEICVTDPWILYFGASDDTSWGLRFPTKEALWEWVASYKGSTFDDILADNWATDKPRLRLLWKN